MKHRTIKASIAVIAALGSGIAAAPSAAAWSCPTTLIEKFELYQPGEGSAVGVLNRYDTAFVCAANPTEEKKSYTRSRMNGGAWHKVTHSIWDMTDGHFLRSTTKSGWDTIQTTALKNRTQTEYHYSGFYVENINGTRLSVQFVGYGN